MKKNFIIFSVIILGILIFILFSFKQKDSKSNNFKEVIYFIDNEPVKMNAANIKYFGNELKMDLNKDGKEDMVFVFTKNSNGSGIFFYVTAAISSNNGYSGTNSILLGDRIAPQNINFIDNKIVVNYTDREITEPFTVQPSIGKSKYLILENNSLKETQR